MYKIPKNQQQQKPPGAKIYYGKVVGRIQDYVKVNCSPIDHQ